MSKQLIDGNDKTGFMNLASDGKSITVIDARAMTGNEIADYMKQYGIVFPIKVESHTVSKDSKGQVSYIDVKGNKKTISAEKAKAYREKQAKQGTIHKEQDIEI